WSSDVCSSDVKGLIAQRSRDPIGHLFEAPGLKHGECIVGRFVRACQVTENGTHFDVRISPKDFSEFIQVVRLEAEPMHAGVKLHVNRTARSAAKISNKRAQNAKAVNFRFETVL